MKKDSNDQQTSVSKSQKYQQALQRRCDYVMALAGRDLEGRCIEIAISEVALRRGEFPPPSVITVRRWLKKWHSTGRLEVLSPWPAKGKKRGLNKNNWLYEE